MAPPYNNIPPLTRRDVLPALLAGAFSYALYARTLAPWLLPGDSGEFQVLAHQVGEAHTTGYPVYMLLAKLFILLVPAASIAKGVSLFSAFMAGLTVALVYLAGRLLTGRRWLALFGAAVLAVGYTFWSQALIAEVYSTGAAFLAGVIVLLLHWYRGGTRWAVSAAGVIGGLGLGVHASVAMLAPAVVLFLLLNWKRRREWLAPALAGAAAGLILFALAFLAVDLNAPPANIFNAAYGPARSNWDLSEADLANPVKRIVFLAAAVQWRSAMFSHPLIDTPARLAEYLMKLPRELSLLSLALVVIGAVALARRDRRLFWFFTLALLVHWASYFNYRVGDLYVFYIPGYAMLALIATVGLDALARGADRAVARLVRPRLSTTGHSSASRGAELVVGIVVAVVAIIAVAIPLAPHAGAIAAGETPFMGEGYLVDRGAPQVEALAEATVRELEDNAIVFTDWNWLYPYYYAAHIKAGRTGMQFIETYSRSDRAGLADSIIEFVRANFRGRPIYFSQPLGEITAAGFGLKPVTAGPTRLYKLEYRP
jgi:hypothetical protein